jgi:hypothetical protein
MLKKLMTIMCSMWVIAGNGNTTTGGTYRAAYMWENEKSENFLDNTQAFYLDVGSATTVGELTKLALLPSTKGKMSQKGPQYLKIELWVPLNNLDSSDDGPNTYSDDSSDPKQVTLQAEDQQVTLEEMQEFQVQMYGKRLEFMQGIDEQLNGLKQGKSVDLQQVIETIQNNSDHSFGGAYGVEMILNELATYVHITKIPKNVYDNISTVINGLSNILYGGNSQ